MGKRGDRWIWTHDYSGAFTDLNIAFGNITSHSPEDYWCEIEEVKE